MNRAEAIRDDIEKTSDSEVKMELIMEALNQTVTPIPEVGKFYTFLYSAKTPRIQYDQHPLIACTDVQRWGFRGENFHLRKSRQYTWDEVIGQLYIVQYDELDELMSYNYQKIILNN